LTKAEKISGKFDMFGLKQFMPEPRHDVNASLQVKPGSMRFSFAVGLDLHNCDHVKLVD
jgi:hypothetical protein